MMRKVEPYTDTTLAFIATTDTTQTQMYLYNT